MSVRKAATPSSYVDGIYRQIEVFSLSVPTKNGGRLSFEVTYDQLVSIGAVIAELLEQREEAHRWPFAEWVARGKTFLPIRRTQ